MDVLVVGAGIVGASCAYFLTRAGLRVTVVDRGGVASGTTGAGEGNILVSDKEPGPELDLALRSTQLWRELAEECGGFEWDPKGGLVVAETQEVLDALVIFAERQQQHGRIAGSEVGTPEGAAPAPADVVATCIAAGDLRELEPHIADGLAGGVHYPQDAQVQPMLAAARLLKASGARLVRTAVERFLVSGDRVIGVRTGEGDVYADAVVNAAGTWAGSFAQAPLPIRPRKGFILVTQPFVVPPIRHKVYTAAYITNVASDAEGLETSGVIESTQAGTVLIGASRQRVGYDTSIDYRVLAKLARQAIGLFPVLADRQVMRAYAGLRPYSPDHLPVIGPDWRLENLFHACGHEGAGIGLAPATAEMITAQITGEPTPRDPAPFAPGRFA
ncbi:NAD(P)/FAD-dependent oxidoreductase [Herbidospora mongoliensis]|uniref:NAD(P)/FAD-dependent oxidoreductase n=1 Tax=Herbidospora mongoliensis TaxID=688067 RepID=UPI001FDF42E1|nr:FAD-binding oxidoreductase [Herbidospora mongoliensis]